MLQAVIFDLDGTLLDTEPDFTIILNKMLAKEGKSPVYGSMVRKFVSDGAAAVVRKGFGITDDDPRLPELLQEFLALYSAQIPQTTASLFDDIDLLIASLHEQGLAWGIMTNKHRRFSEPLLQRFENFATAGALVCPDDVGAGKPDPRGILRACELLGVGPAACAYVGDHPRDMDAAHKAGMRGVAVSWGYLPENNHISSWGADVVLHTPVELIDWCKRVQSAA